MANPNIRYVITYNSSMNRSAGDDGYPTKRAALAAFMRCVQPVITEHDANVNLQEHKRIDGAWHVRVIAAKYVGETGVRIFAKYFTA